MKEDEEDFLEEEEEEKDDPFQKILDYNKPKIDPEKELQQKVKKQLKDRRLTIPYKDRIRNLKQYKDLSDDEFEEAFAKKVLGTEPDRVWVQRIERKMQEFGDSYDLSDLKVNDTMILRSLASAIVRLEDFENVMTKLTSEGISEDNILVVEKLGKAMTDLRKDISSMQEDLKITRKSRKGDKEQTVMAYIDDLKAKAKEFYESRMSYVFCPKCNMLLGTVWFLYPNAKNKILFICQRELENGEKCGTNITVTSKDLMENRGTNKKELLPESMR